MNKATTFPRRLGRLMIDPVSRKMKGPTGDASVEPLVMRLLVRLHDEVGEVVPRRDLFATLWGNAQVGDDSLNRLVMRLREALRQAAGNDIVVETVPRVGYRLIEASGTQEPHLDRRTVVALGAVTTMAIVGTAMWRRRAGRSDEARIMIDEGDTLLRDAAPIEAAKASPPLRQALRLDPNNARAWGLLALAEETAANNGGRVDAGAALKFAEGAAKTALARDPTEPHAKLALLDMSGATLDWLQWERQLFLLNAAAPTNLHVLGSLSSFLQAVGKTARSSIVNDRAAAFAPSSPTPQWRRALRLWTSGREDEALQLSERIAILWPRHPLVLNARFVILAFTNRLAAAAEMVGRPNQPSNLHTLQREQWTPTFAALADPTSARLAAAREANLAAATRSPGQAIYSAMALSQLGQLDAAFSVIDALLLAKGPLITKRAPAPGNFAANSPSWCRTQWLFMPPLAPVRTDPRFASLCDEIGLTRYWRVRGKAD